LILLRQTFLVAYLFDEQMSVWSQMTSDVFVHYVGYTQERFSAKEPPEHYLNKMRVFLDPAGNRSSRVWIFTSLIDVHYSLLNPSVLWCCCLGNRKLRKGIQSILQKIQQFPKVF